MFLTRLAFVLVTATAAACGGSSPQPVTGSSAPVAEKVLVNVNDAGVALSGNDAVAYVVDGKATPGVAEHTSSHGGATYQFTSAEHKAAFDAEPDRFVPRYGGYCAFAAAQNRLSQVEADQFEIYDGHLLLFTNADFHAQFDKDPAGNKAKADANWPGLVAKHGR